MKYIAIIPDGLGDHPQPSLADRTPLEAAKTPNLDYLAKIGRVGEVLTIPEGYPSGSDVGNMALLGYDPKECYSGRAPIEAANMGITLKEGEVAFRMNLITEADGMLADYSAGHIPTPESKRLVEYLNDKLGDDNVALYPGISYRHIAVIRDRSGLDGLKAQCTPPHDIQGKPIQNHLPRGPGEGLLKKLMFDAKLLLQNHEVNQVRVDLKENPANMVWFWGQGVTPKVRLFKEKFGLNGGIISAVDLVNGIGKLIGLESIAVPGATGFLDTNYAGKAEYALKFIEDHDFVFIHIEATDEAGHMGKIKEKVQAIEAVDCYIASAVKKYLEAHKASTRVMVATDHATPCELRGHSHDMVPFIITGKDVIPDDVTQFSEKTAQASDLKIHEGFKLMEYFLKR